MQKTNNFNLPKFDSTDTLETVTRLALNTAMDTIDNELSNNTNADVLSLVGFSRSDYGWALRAIASATGLYSDSTTRIASKRFILTKGSTISISLSGASFTVARFNLDGTFKGASSFVNWTTTFTEDVDEIVGITVRKSSSNPTISSSEIADLGASIQIAFVPRINGRVNGVRIDRIRLAAGASTSFSAEDALAVCWNTNTCWGIFGFRNSYSYTLDGGSGVSNIAVAHDGTTYTITNNSSIYLRGFVVAAG